jgi:Bacterial membrane protein YfhO
MLWLRIKVERPIFLLRQSYLIITALGLLFFAELVGHPGQVLYSDHSDLLAMHLPLKCFLVRAWQENGEIPLWNPYSFAGMPFAHDVQVAIFYPLHRPLLLLPEDWIGPALSWLVVLHVLIAGWCMLAYAHSRRLGGVGSLVAAMGYMFAGKWLLHILAGGHYIMIGLAWLPLVLLFFERGLVRKHWMDAVWAGVVFSLTILSTHPQLTLYAGLFTALWSLGVLRLGRRGERGQRVWRPSWRELVTSLVRWLGMGTCAAATAASLAAIQLLPALEASTYSTRGAGVRVQDILAAGFPSLLGLVGPGCSGGWEDKAAVGCLWLASGCIAPVFRRGRARFEAGICLLLVAYSVGGAALVQGLPGFRLFQIPGRMFMLLAFPIALLAGQTTKMLLASRNRLSIGARVRRVFFRAFFAGLFLTLLPVFQTCRQWCVEHPSSTCSGWISELNVSVSVYCLTLLFTGLVAALLLGENSRWARRAWVWAWCTILLADAWMLAAGHVQVRPTAEIYAPAHSVTELARAAGKASSAHWRVLERGEPGIPSSAPLGAALPLLGQIQIESALGYNSFDVRRFKEYLQFISDEDRPVEPRVGIFGYPIVQAFPIRNRSLVDLLGVKYLLQPRLPSPYFEVPGEPGTAGSRWRRVAQDAAPRTYSFLEGGMKRLPAYQLYENADAFPRAYVVHSAEALTEPSKVLQQLKSTDLHRTVLLEAELAPSVGRELPNQDGADSEAVRICDYRPNRVVIDVTTGTAGYLVLTDPWFPGWECTVDGQPQELYRANFVFRAVAVSPGTHRVVFRFRPRSYDWGKNITVSAILAVLALGGLNVLIALRRRNQSPGTDSPNLQPRFGPPPATALGSEQ